ncbi:hypothetical protein VB618_08385 [Microvirga sp. CF3062]|uniref:hypothetical protein n=1 Tax=Microvirga sp. CF3062 TaxID=3110182 RepID=UPI002E77AAF8|nr:hypothetical protein [Microvirga sp. CF3062]MEE1656211.1 hypothetical protein [Microvirga sp. CF3062]
MPDEKIDQRRPVDAQNEPKPIQQRHVDDAVDDSFPASDPPAWTTSASKSVAAECEPDALNEVPVPPGQGIEEQSSTILQSTARQAADTARDFYQRSRTYLEQGRRYVPEAERYYRQGAETIGRPLQQHPVAAVLLIGALGCALGWMLGRRTSEASHARLWHAGSNRRPIDTQAWRPAPRSVSREHRFSTRDDIEAASRTNNSF